MSRGRRLALQTPRHTIRYGLSEHANVRASKVEQAEGAMHFKLHLPDGSEQQVTLNLPGQHNVLNALAAAAVGWQLGVSPKPLPAR